MDNGSIGGRACGECMCRWIIVDEALISCGNYRFILVGSLNECQGRVEKMVMCLAPQGMTDWKGGF